MKLMITLSKEKQNFKESFEEHLKQWHKPAIIRRYYQRVLRKTNTAKASMKKRARETLTKFQLEAAELRWLWLRNYKTPCRYCGRTLTLDNMVFDHFEPVSSGGPSVIGNIQVICSPCNGLKGSLSDQNLDILLQFLEKAPDELAKDLRIRLSRGIH